MAKPLFVIGVLVMAALGALSLYYASKHITLPMPSASFKVVHVGKAALTLEVADTEAQREQGLSGRASVAPADGMLFVFDADQRPAIWMKDMHFALDILWVNASGTVVMLKENVQPSSYPEVFRPEAPARYVIELPAGEAAQKGIAEGTIVVL
jgi:uncharacterized membrane protein (UPF0127 family)